MPTPTSPEATAIEAAYQDQVMTLFKVLADNLAIEPVTHESDQQSVAKFTAGLNIARRAKDLALNAAGAALPTTETVARHKKSKKT